MTSFNDLSQYKVQEFERGRIECRVIGCGPEGVLLQAEAIQPLENLLDEGNPHKIERLLPWGDDLDVSRIELFSQCEAKANFGALAY